MRQILFFLLMLVVGLQAYYYTVMPDYVARHYALGGLVDSWSSKEWNLTFKLILILSFNAFFIFLPKLLEVIPKDFINLPNKDYWFTENRIKSAFKGLVDCFDGMMVTTNVFFIFVFHLDFIANMNPVHKLNAMLLIFGLMVYCGVLVLWTLALHRKFNLPK